MSFDAMFDRALELRRRRERERRERRERIAPALLAGLLVRGPNMDAVDLALRYTDDLIDRLDAKGDE